jgi:hypothetical protein
MPPKFADNKNITRINGHKKTGNNITPGSISSVYWFTGLRYFLYPPAFWGS